MRMSKFGLAWLMLIVALPLHAAAPAAVPALPSSPVTGGVASTQSAWASMSPEQKREMRSR